MASWRRTHTCGELRAEHAGQEVRLNGWVSAWRDHGGLTFIDLRDRYGLAQVVFDPADGAELQELARTLRNEHVVAVWGQVRPRLAGKENPKLPTGAIELRALKLEVLNRSEPPPFEIADAYAADSNEELRLRYRYLDLRRPRMQEIFRIRCRINQTIRSHLDAQGFYELETPMLGKSTPEGARDFLVPSRTSPGEWYALPQSPQLYKQILMVAGYDKYYQIARCFRDEDLRANRQPEFTQLDFEMSFVDAEDVMGTIEGLSAALVQEVLGRTVATPFPRLSYAEAMRRFGCDKPDLRFAMEIADLKAAVTPTEFAVFASAEAIRGICAKGAADKHTRKTLDELTAYAKEFGAKGLAWFKVEADGKLAGPSAKFLTAGQPEALKAALGAGPGDLLLVVADTYEASHAPLAALRNRLAKELKLYDPAALHFSWVVEFPMFEHDPDTGKWVAKHHPFTTLLDEDWPKLESAPDQVRAKAYDLIINGEEAGGGTIRIHDPVQQAKIFTLLGLDDATAKARFGFLLEALKFGAPPHGGIAFGIDRWTMIFAGLENIRDCILFPKTSKGSDLMTGAPAAVERKQLKELGLG